MAEGSDLRSDFKFILNTVRADAVDAVAYELTQLFPLDKPTATNIAKNAPIILLDNLTPQQARKVGTYAIRLKALGADVQVTGQPVGKLQVLRWPLMPDIAKRPANHLICPNCGARLHVQILVPTSETEEEAPKPAEPDDKAPEPAPEVEPVVTDVPANLDAQPEPQLEATAEEPPPLEGDVIEEVLLEPIGDPPGEEPDPLFELELETEPEPEPGLEEDEPAVAAMEIASEASGGIGGEGSCRVTIVGKVKGRKKQNAAELMAEYLGVDAGEALSRLNKRSVVTVGIGLTQKQAEKCRKAFADIGVKVTIKG